MTELKNKEVKQEVTKKELIVLHHTVSNGTADSVINWWNSTPEAVAVSYIIDKAGKIYETFDDKYWSWHIGMGATREHNKRSIGIELINVGILEKHGPKICWANTNVEYLDPYEYYEEAWRGYHYFAKYTDAQYATLKSLLKVLCDKHNIPYEVITSYQYDKSLLNFKGIISHHNVRSDKTDVSRAFDFTKIK